MCVFCIVIHRMDRRIARFTYRTLESKGCKSAGKKRWKTWEQYENGIRERNYDLYYFATEMGPTNLVYSSGIVYHRRCQKSIAIYGRDESARRIRNRRTYKRVHKFFLFYSLRKHKSARSRLIHSAATPIDVHDTKFIDASRRTPDARPNDVIRVAGTPWSIRNLLGFRSKPNDHAFPGRRTFRSSRVIDLARPSFPNIDLFSWLSYFPIAISRNIYARRNIRQNK